MSWFEEPVSSDDLEGLRLLRDRAPAGMDIAAGEYGYDLLYFRRMLEAGAVDVLQADATRCGGRHRLSSGRCALPGLWLAVIGAHGSVAARASVLRVRLTARNVEYFHDHVRIEQMFFEGARSSRRRCAQAGSLAPGPGSGTETPADVEKYQCLWQRYLKMNAAMENQPRWRRAMLHQTTPPTWPRASRTDIEGEVRFDSGSRALYATDGSNYRQVPIGVVIPKSVDDVDRGDRRLPAVMAHPILARGGGTSLAGQCCNVAVVFDCSKYLNRILALDPEREAGARSARRRAGLVARRGQPVWT